MSNAVIDLSFADISTDALKQELAEGLRLTAGHLRRMACIVAELETRGVDLTDLKIGLLGYLRRIAAGQVLPEVVVRFAEHPLLIQRIATLPLPDQERLANGEHVQLAVVGPDGTIAHRMADPCSLVGKQVNQVFSVGAIRTVSSQVLLLEARRAEPPKQREVRRRVSSDRERGGITVGRAFASQADVLAALAELRGTEEDDAEAEQTCLVKLTEKQHLRLKVRAAEGGTTMQALVRDALRMAGL
jgi:hypothetical protein